MADEEMLSTMKALSDMNRLKIIEMLMPGEVCACKLLEQLDVTQPTLSHHMKVLTDSGIVSVRKEGQRMLYRINGQRIAVLRDYFTHLVDVCIDCNPDCRCSRPVTPNL